ncbi:hypothetical protein ABZW30_22000 [Kitasatospora sp. NPDC004669]
MTIRHRVLFEPREHRPMAASHQPKELLEFSDDQRCKCGAHP